MRKKLDKEFIYLNTPDKTYVALSEHARAIWNVTSVVVQRALFVVILF